MNSLSIGIAGAGVIGRLLAMALVRDGHRVTIFDQDPLIKDNRCDAASVEQPLPDLGTSACSYTAAGMLTPFSESDVAEPLIVDLGVKSLQLWPEIIKLLGAEVFYRTGGTLIVSHRQDTADFNRFFSATQANLSARKEKIALIDQPQLAKLEPEISGLFHQAAYVPDENWLCSCCVMPALGSWLQQQVSWHSHTQVLSVEAKTIITKARTGSRSHTFDWAIDCRGLGAKQQLPTLRGVRGEILWLRAPEVKINRLVRLMHPHYRIYIVPRRDNLYLVGATQLESEDCGPMTVRSNLELLSAAYSVHAGFGEAKIVHSGVNLRPAFPDNQPRVYMEPGVIRVNGLFRHGYLMSPAIAAEISAAITAKSGYSSSFKHLFQHQTQPEAIAQ